MMKQTKELLAQARKIVIKIGTSTLANEDGSVNVDFLDNLAASIATLHESGKQVVLVSSGARIAGVARLGKWARKSDTNYKQALCAIGQVELMASYSKIFKEHHLTVGQILVTKKDLTEKERELNIRNTLFTLTDEGVVPIVNENDTVSVEEIKVGDNDTLSAHMSVLWNADALILLSDIDGLYDKNPKEHADAALIATVDPSARALQNISIGDAGGFGTGGIATKISAAKIATSYGIPVVLTNGSTPDVLLQLKDGAVPSTLFEA